MQHEGFLLAIAQIAVTLAGFSGLVVAIRGAPPTAWHPRDIWSLSWMFGTSLGALFMALLPLMLAFFHLRDGLVWTVANLVMAAFMIVFAVAMGLSGRRLHQIGTSVSCPLLSHCRGVPAFDVRFFVRSGRGGCFPATQNRILRFRSARMLARVSALAGRVSGVLARTAGTRS